MNISNILTLRYDPHPSTSAITDEYSSGDGATGIRNITHREIARLRRIPDDGKDENIPSPQELENAVTEIIRKEVEQSKSKRATLALSSGIDSNVISCLFCKEFPNLNMECINVTFGDNSSEADHAAVFAESMGAGFHVVHVDNPLVKLPLLLSIVKEPRWNVYQYYFIQKAKSLSDILFTGDGGDELFAGYTFRYKRYLVGINNSASSSWEDRVRAYLSCHERDWVPDQEDIFAGTQVNFSWSSICDLIREYFDNNLDPLEQVLLADCHGKLLYDFIPTNEKLFRYFDITGVAPLLSKKVIDLSVKIPAHLKYDFSHDIGKLQLREIIKQNIGNRYYQRERKIGFGMDLTNLWVKAGKELVTSNLEKGRVFEDKIINREWYNKSLSKIAGESKEAIRYISKMLQLLSLEIWYKLFITGEMNANSSL